MSVQYTYNDNRYETGLPQPYMNMRIGDVLHVGVALAHIRRPWNAHILLVIEARRAITVTVERIRVGSELARTPERVHIRAPMPGSFSNTRPALRVTLVSDRGQVRVGAYVAKIIYDGIPE